MISWFSPRSLSKIFSSVFILCFGLCLKAYPLAFTVRDLGLYDTVDRLYKVAGNAQAVNDAGDAAIVWRGGVYGVSRPDSQGSSTATYIAYGRPFAINEDGWIVGRMGSKPFVWTSDDGTLHSLVGSHYVGSATDVNDQGVVVGQAAHWGGLFFGFTWQEDTGLTRLPMSWGSGHSGAYGINESGQIVGFMGKDPVLWYLDGNQYTYDILPHPAQARAEDVNDSGVVVGWYGYNAQPREAVFWVPDGQGGYVMETLEDVSGAGNEWDLIRAYGVNDAGWIIGRGKHNGLAVPFVYTPMDGVKDINSLLDTPGYRISEVNDISDSGIMAAMAYHRVCIGNRCGTRPVPVLLYPDRAPSPVREPATGFLLGSAVILAAWRKKRGGFPV